MSHEIRTPLTGILGFTDVLLAGGDDGDVAKRRDYLATIQASGQHLLALINDILDLSKIEAGRLEFESEACHADRSRGRRRLACCRSRPTRSRSISTCAGTRRFRRSSSPTRPRVRQILMNLVGNAIKFTARAASRSSAASSKPTAGRSSSSKCVDTGIGIAAGAARNASSSRSSRPTARSRAASAARGWGWRSAAASPAALGGDLTADSELGEGSTFTLAIDAGDVARRAADRRPPRPSTTTDAAERRGAPRTRLPRIDVLLVEDGETNRKLIKLLLRAAPAPR